MHHSILFQLKQALLMVSVLHQPVESHFQAILTVGISYRKIVFAVKTYYAPLWVPFVTFLYALPQTVESIIMCNLALAYFTTYFIAF